MLKVTRKWAYYPEVEHSGRMAISIVYIRYGIGQANTVSTKQRTVDLAESLSVHRFVLTVPPVRSIRGLVHPANNPNHIESGGGVTDDRRKTDQPISTTNMEVCGGAI